MCVPADSLRGGGLGNLLWEPSIPLSSRRYVGPRLPKAAKFLKGSAVLMDTRESVVLGTTTTPSRAGASDGRFDGVWEFLLRERSHPSAAWWPERLAAVLALAGVLATSLAGYHVRRWPNSGSDFKTVYASGTNLLRGLPAYRFENLAPVFQRQGVTPPPSWYAHAPIYPPFTPVLLAPILALPMAAAVYVWMALSALALLGALWAMSLRLERGLATGGLRLEESARGLSRRWRLLLLVLVAVSPLLSFGLQIGNLSVMASSLCLVAVMCVEVAPTSLLAVALAASLLLKPHLPLFLLLGMCVSRHRADRVLAVRAFFFFAAAVGLSCLALRWHHPLGLQLHDWSAMLHLELTSGSMNPSSRQILPVEAEITSLQTLFGFFGNGAWLPALSWAVLVPAGALLVRASRSAASGSGEERLELLGAWSTFGMLVTYHRTHDALLLLLLLPWMLLRWRRRRMDPVAWSVLLLFAAISFSAAPSTLEALAAHHGLSHLAQFLLFRQAALATFLLLVLLIGHLLYRASTVRVSGAVRRAGGGSDVRPAVAWASRPSPFG